MYHLALPHLSLSGCVSRRASVFSERGEKGRQGSLGGDVIGKGSTQRGVNQKPYCKKVGGKEGFESNSSASRSGIEIPD